jgi:hypothetical protein
MCGILPLSRRTGGLASDDAARLTDERRRQQAIARMRQILVSYANARDARAVEG